MSAEPMNCHDVQYRGFGLIHIPGCIGCAVYDHERCTCPDPERQAAEERELRAWARLERMRARRRAAELDSEGLAAFPVEPRPTDGRAPSLDQSPPTSIVRYFR